MLGQAFSVENVSMPLHLTYLRKSIFSHTNPQKSWNPSGWPAMRSWTARCMRLDGCSIGHNIGFAICESIHCNWEFRSDTHYTWGKVTLAALQNLPFMLRRLALGKASIHQGWEESKLYDLIWWCGGSGFGSVTLALCQTPKTWAIIHGLFIQFQSGEGQCSYFHQALPQMFMLSPTNIHKCQSSTLNICFPASPNGIQRV